jgi:hypothetical protein
LLDPHLRKDLSPAKRLAWIRDQYRLDQGPIYAPSRTQAYDVGGSALFDEMGFDFINSIPKIVGGFAADERLFARNNRGSSTDRILAELEMLFTRHGGEGGLYIMIGRKK